MLFLGVELTNRFFKAAVVAAASLLAAARLSAQAQTNGGNAQPAASTSAVQDPARVQTQSTQNPFPEDTSAIPVMPSKSTADLPPDTSSNVSNAPLPVDDADPVRTPEDAQATAEENEKSFSSSQSGLGNLLPPSDEEPQPDRRNRHGKQQVVEEHHETAAEDESVGSYYLDKKNWKAALSRYQSALVLDPDNPEVYWGLAECARNLGDFAGARSNYQKVVDYDPESRHGKEARKALKDPQIANAKPNVAVQK
jgi:tetratricopeptide (TPR) repeat protein